MSYSITQGSTASDTTRIGSHGAITPGTPDAVITFPQATGTTSLGQSMVASGIITMSPTPGDASCCPNEYLNKRKWINKPIFCECKCKFRYNSCYRFRSFRKYICNLSLCCLPYNLI